MEAKAEQQKIEIVDAQEKNDIADKVETEKDETEEEKDEIKTNQVEIEKDEIQVKNVEQAESLIDNVTDPLNQGNFSLLTDDNSAIESDKSDVNLNYSSESNKEDVSDEKPIEPVETGIVYEIEHIQLLPYNQR